MDEKTQQRLLEVADQIEIERVLGLYCRAIDRCDPELLKSIYHPDAIDDHGAFALPAHEIADTIIARLREVCIYSMHSVSHCVIEVRGARASSEACYFGVHTIAGGGTAIENFFGPKYAEAQRRTGLLDQAHEYFCGGRYLDEFEKREGAWKILHRRITNEWGVCQPRSNTSEGLPAAFYTPGRRDRDDPVYRLAIKA